MNTRTGNVLLCGVGGQGVLLASEVLAGAAMAAGLDVKKSEVHGMAQRGGSVTSHVRWGVTVHSPLIEEGTANALLAFEPAEALRWSHFLAADGVIITAREPIFSVLVSSGLEAYPADGVERRHGRCGRLVAVDANAEAKASGNPRAVNVLLLGILSRFAGLPQEAWLQAVRDGVPANTIDSNLKAFARGRALADEGV